MTTAPVTAPGGTPTSPPEADLACAPLTGAPALDAAAADRLAATLKALADPSRLRMLSLVAATGQACVCDLAGVVDVSQPTVSHHLKVLRDAGVVTAERRGTWVHYRLADDAAPLVHHLLDATTERTPR